MAAAIRWRASSDSSRSAIGSSSSSSRRNTRRHCAISAATSPRPGSRAGLRPVRQARPQACPRRSERAMLLVSSRRSSRAGRPDPTRPSIRSAPERERPARSRDAGQSTRPSGHRGLPGLARRLVDGRQRQARCELSHRLDLLLGKPMGGRQQVQRRIGMVGGSHRETMPPAAVRRQAAGRSMPARNSAATMSDCVSMPTRRPVGVDDRQVVAAAVGERRTSGRPVPGCGDAVSTSRVMMSPTSHAASPRRARDRSWPTKKSCSVTMPSSARVRHRPRAAP